MGSGHILVYAFDVLMQLYESAGWSQRDAAVSIVQNNLYGLDIDDRAFQLAYFAVMMKARQYNRRIFSKPVPHHLYSIQESNEVNRTHLAYLGANLSELEKNDATNQMLGLLDALHDAKSVGSLLCLKELNWELLHRFAADTEQVGQMSFEAVGIEQTCTQLQTLLEIAEVLARQYDVVVTNPPYMAVSNGDAALNKYIKDNYPDSKGDLFAAFIERCGRFARKNGYQAMITQHAWMFLSSFEKLRTKLLQSADIVNMAHLGARAFEEIGGEVVQTTSFVLCRAYTRGYKGTYCRLVEPTTQQGKEDMFLAGENRYVADQVNFSQIPGKPVAYWASKNLISAFEKGFAMDEIGASRSGMQTGDNNRFLRFWYEVIFQDIKFDTKKGDNLLKVPQKWFPQPKGGSYRKWYGNFEYVVNFKNDGEDLRNFTGTSIIKNPQFYFIKGICWSHTTSKCFSGRFMPEGCIFNVESPTFYPFEEEMLDYVLAFSNTKILDRLFAVISQTMHYMAGDMAKIPIIQICDTANIEHISQQNISLSRSDWDSNETSWDFKRHPLV